MGGVSFHRVAGWARLPFDKQGQYVLPAGTGGDPPDAIADDVAYAVGDEPFGLEAAIDKAAGFAGPDRRQSGRHATGVRASKRDQQAAARSLGTRRPPAAWTGAIDSAIGRSPTSPTSATRTAFPTADLHRAFPAVSRAIRSVHAGAQIGMAIAHRSLAWGNYLLFSSRPVRLRRHYYSSPNVQPVVRGRGPDRQLPDPRRNPSAPDALLRLYNPSATCTIRHGMGPALRSGPQGGASRQRPPQRQYLGHDAPGGPADPLPLRVPFRGASSWEMFTYRAAPPDLRLSGTGRSTARLRTTGCTTTSTAMLAAGCWRSTARLPTTTVQRTGVRTVALTPVVATLSLDEQQLYLILANGSWEKTVPVRMTLRGFAPRGAVRQSYSATGDPDGDPFLARREDLVRTVGRNPGPGNRPPCCNRTLWCSSRSSVRVAEDGNVAAGGTAGGGIAARAGVLPLFSLSRRQPSRKMAITRVFACNRISLREELLC